MIKVTNEITVYERDDEPYESGHPPIIEVRSHWSRRELVVLRLPDGTRLTVNARDLETAIKNATNTAKY